MNLAKEFANSKTRTAREEPCGFWRSEPSVAQVVLNTRVEIVTLKLSGKVDAELPMANPMFRNLWGSMVTSVAEGVKIIVLAEGVPANLKL